MVKDHKAGPTPARPGYVRPCALVLAAAAYAFSFRYTPTLTGTTRMDGVIGVLLGLYVCSYPAANFLDMLLFGGRSAPWFSSGRSVFLWLVVNVLVMSAGWFDIFIGAVKLAAAGP